jgi:hypothetical protein
MHYRPRRIREEAESAATALNRPHHYIECMRLKGLKFDIRIESYGFSNHDALVVVCEVD